MHCAELNNGLFMILRLHSYMENFMLLLLKVKILQKYKTIFYNDLWEHQGNNVQIDSHLLNLQKQ